MMYHRASVILEDPAAAKYVWGVGFHWYTDDEFDNVERVHEAFPAAHLIFTEGCHGPFDLAQAGDWHWGESYGRSMINDFNNGTEGWTDWNVLVDERGGPNHVSNFCFAPVIAMTATGELRYMSSYWYIGHFSKFVRPGARRVACASMSDDLLATAFRNPDGSLAVVVMNASGNDHAFFLWTGGRAAPLTLRAHSIATVLTR
jgi:glucosylceramidase